MLFAFRYKWMLFYVLLSWFLLWMDRTTPPPILSSQAVESSHSVLYLCRLWSNRNQTRKICHLARRTKSAAPNRSDTVRGSNLEMTKWYCIHPKTVWERCCGYRFTSAPSGPLPWTKSLDIFKRPFLCQVVAGWCRVVEATALLHKWYDRIWQRLTRWWHIC